jgi:hypothetical protein
MGGVFLNVSLLFEPSVCGFLFGLVLPDCFANVVAGGRAVTAAVLGQKRQFRRRRRRPLRAQHRIGELTLPG